MTETTYNELKRGIEDLQKNVDVVAPNFCIKIALEVLKDKRVQDAFIELINNGYLFEGVSCEPFGLDETYVYFQFGCKPPRICFIVPLLRVTYDLSLHKVVKIEHLSVHNVGHIPPH